MRRSAILALLILGAAACGGGSGSVSSGGIGGSKDAYCAKIADFETVGSALDGNDDLQTAITFLKRFSEVVAAAPAEIKADVGVVNEVYQKLANALDDVDPDDEDALFAAVFGALASVDQDRLGASATKVDTYTNEQCGIDLDLDDLGSSVRGTTSTTDLSGQSSTTTTASEETTTTTSGSGSTTSTTEAATGTTSDGTSGLPDPDPVPGGGDAALNELAQKCHDGDMQACDDLFSDSEIGSEYEDYGNTCGGRVPNNGQYCVEVYPNH